MSALESSILHFIQHAYNLMQWPGVVALMAIESACIPIPSEIIMPLAGWMLIKNLSLPVAFNLLAGLLGAVGCTIGSLAAYWVGTKGGRPFLNKYGKYVLITPHDLDRADTMVSKERRLGNLHHEIDAANPQLYQPSGRHRKNAHRQIYSLYLGRVFYLVYRFVFRWLLPRPELG